jgi:hypothetical protein
MSDQILILALIKRVGGNAARAGWWATAARLASIAKE